MLENTEDLFGLDKVVDDIVYRMWDCGKCLSMGHSRSDCKNKLRCRKCFKFGHIEKQCLPRQEWVPKNGNAPDVVVQDSSTHIHLTHVVVPVSEDPVANTPSSPVLNPNAPPLPSALLLGVAMANYEVDPTPWIPHGQIGRASCRERV